MTKEGENGPGGAGKGDQDKRPISIATKQPLFGGCQPRPERPAGPTGVTGVAEAPEAKASAWLNLGDDRYVRKSEVISVLKLSNPSQLGLVKVVTENTDYYVSVRTIDDLMKELEA